MGVKLADFYKEDGIYTENLHEAVQKLGASRLLEEINCKIDNPNFSVGFSFSDIETGLAAGDYTDLFMDYHWLILKNLRNQKR